MTGESGCSALGVRTVACVARSSLTGRDVDHAGQQLGRVGTCRGGGEPDVGAGTASVVQRSTGEASGSVTAE